MSLFARRYLSVLMLTGALTTALSSTPAIAQTALPQADRVTASVSLRATTRLAGHVPSWTRTAPDAGTPSPDTTLSLTLVLTRSPDRQAAFEQMLAAQQTPGSPSYHHWLTPQQIGTLYGPTQHDLDALTTWLTGQGFAVTDVAPSRTFITAQAPLSTVANTFAVSFRLFTLTGSDGLPETRPRIAATADPAIPSAFASIVSSITGLSDVPVYPMIRTQSAPRPASASETPALSISGIHLITPNDFAVLYDLNTVYKSGINGAGQRVAIIGRSRVAAADITSFETITAQPAVQPTVIIPPTGTDPGITNTIDQDEATLDVDRIIGTAPGAGIDLVISAAGTTTLSAVQLAAQYEVNTVRDPIMNISFGTCETNVGASYVAFWDALFSQAAAQGISSFVSSGDAGAAACQSAGRSPVAPQARSINAICSSSYATCVGGTEFADTASPNTYWSPTNGTGYLSALSYIPEGAWNESPGSGSAPFFVVGTGGGVSAIVPKPSWQTGTGVPADGFRDVPDVSFSASAHDGYLGCLAYHNQDCTSSVTLFSGTSASAPGMAGIAALLNQKKGSAQGNLNPLLYNLAATSASVFHDATPSTSGVATCDINTPSMCNNSTPSATSLTGGLAGFALTVGYDQATGLGSLDGANFLNATPVAPRLTLTAATSSLTLTAGSTTGNTDALTLSAINYTGAATLTCAVAYNGTGTPALAPNCSVSPSGVTLASGGTASSLLTIGSAMPRLASTSHTVAAAASPATTHAPGGTITTLSGLTLGSLALLAFVPGRRLRTLRNWQTLPTALLLLGTLSALVACSGSSTPVAGNPLLLSASTTTVVPAVSTLPAGASTTATAIVVNSGFNTTVAPTGTVQFFVNGSNAISGALQLVAGSATSPAFSLPTAGAYGITANYSGDANFKPSSATGAPLTVTAVGTTTGSYTVTVTATSTTGITATQTVALTIQ
jgi:pseudomonalisin